MIQVVTEDGSGSAFHIGGGWFVTAAHVVVDSGEITLHGERDVEAELAAYDTSIDLAFLYASDLSVPSLPLAEMSALEAFSELVVIGYPTGVTGDASPTIGRLSRLLEYPGGITFLQTDAASNPGNSGGPVINECGEVVGVVVSKLVGVDIEGIAYAVGADTVASYLELEEPEGFLWDIFGEAVGYCSSDLEVWLKGMLFELDRLVDAESDFGDAWNLAVEEQWALMENDPTWQSAIVALAFRFEEPALTILDLLPSPASSMSDSDYLLRDYASVVADFGQAMPRAIRLSDSRSRDLALDDLDTAKEHLFAWIDSLYESLNLGCT